MQGLRETAKGSLGLMLLFYLIKWSIKLGIILYCNKFKGTVRKIDKWSLTYFNKSWKFRIPTIHNFEKLYQWNLLFSLQVVDFLALSIVFSVHKQNFTAQ